MADGFVLYTTYYGLLDFNFQICESACYGVRMLSLHFQASNSQEKHRFTLQVAVKAAVTKVQGNEMKVALAI